MAAVRFALDPAFAIGSVGRRLFGSFVEHMGRSVYSGIYEPSHPTADAAGTRGDVLELVRELGVSVVRYPGGNFVSSYRWEDGVGPVEHRPHRLDLAWRSLESNEFGVNEFLSWCADAGTEPMLAVNLGTRGVQEACDLLEYCNHPSGTYLSDLRAAHGVEKPHGVRLWCLGNEMDGPWQIGGKTADEYGRLAAETGKAMRLLDPEVELVLCGSSNSTMPTFGSWEATVLEHAYDYVDYLSLHSYYDPSDGDLDSFLASAVEMDRFIDAVIATCDHVAARTRRRRKINLSFDEWNVWYQGAFSGPEKLEWQRAPRLIEDQYTVADAVVVGSLLISLLRHADRVSVACLAQLVNVIAPIMTQPGGPAWAQTIFHPFALTARYAGQQVLRVEPVGPTYDTARHGDVPVVDATATIDADGAVAMFVVNRSRDTVPLQVDLQALPGRTTATHTALYDADCSARNTVEDPQRVRPRDIAAVAVDDGVMAATLPAVSWNLIRLAPPAVS
jgi:alpha-N-arabinofuranosidase